jgi:hypothetical protein
MVSLVREINVPTEVAVMLHTGRPQLAATLTRRLTLEEQRQVVNALIVYMETLEVAECEKASYQAIIAETSSYLLDVRDKHKESAKELSAVLDKTITGQKNNCLNHKRRYDEQKAKLSRGESA